jgi:hypothetical protein
MHNRFYSENLQWIQEGHSFPLNTHSLRETVS